MPLYEPIIPYRYVAPLVEILREENPAGLRDILAAADLAGAENTPPDSALPMAGFDRLLLAASNHLGRQDLGFELGQRISVENHSPLSQALARCTTVEKLLLVIERYYHLVTPAFSARYHPGERHCEWRIRVTAPMSQATLHMCLEMHAVSIHRDLVRMLGAGARGDCYLSAPDPPHRARYERLPYTRFHFNAQALPEVRCVLATDAIRRPLLAPASRTVAADDGDIAAASPAKLQPATRYGDWVGLMLQEAQTVQPTVKQLAALLNMSPRTLARKLTAEGINFRKLSTRIRAERARAMLADAAIPLPQIAYQLGYSDPTAFIRGFRSAAGTTPALYRERQTSAS